MHGIWKDKDKVPFRYRFCYGILILIPPPPQWMMLHTGLMMFKCDAMREEEVHKRLLLEIWDKLFI